MAFEAAHHCAPCRSARPRAGGGRRRRTGDAGGAPPVSPAKSASSGTPQRRHRRRVDEVRRPAGACRAPLRPPSCPAAEAPRRGTADRPARFRRGRFANQAGRGLSMARMSDEPSSSPRRARGRPCDYSTARCGGWRGGRPPAAHDVCCTPMRRGWRPEAASTSPALRPRPVWGDCGRHLETALPHHQADIHADRRWMPARPGFGGDFDPWSACSTCTVNDPSARAGVARAAPKLDGFFLGIPAWGLETLHELRALAGGRDEAAAFPHLPRRCATPDKRRRRLLCALVADADRLTIRYGDPPRLLGRPEGRRGEQRADARRRSFLARGTLMRALMSTRSGTARGRAGAGDLCLLT